MIDFWQVARRIRLVLGVVAALLLLLLGAAVMGIRSCVLHCQDERPPTTADPTAETTAPTSEDARSFFFPARNNSPDRADNGAATTPDATNPTRSLP